jgi:hypothetical protein
MAAASDLDGALRDYLREALPFLLRAAASWEPLALFLSGSARWGEFVALRLESGRWLPLSDLDLFLVVARRTEDLNRRLRAELGRLDPGPFVEHPARPGSFAAADLGRQAPTLGLGELHAASCCLWGDAGWLARFPDPRRTGLPRFEVLRLLLNRCLELVAAWAGRDRWAPWRRDYALEKAAADLGTAILARHGLLVWGAGERWRRLEACAAGWGVPQALVDRIGRAVRRRLDPAPAGRTDEEAWREGTPLRELAPWIRWVRDSLVAWMDRPGDPRALLAQEGVGSRESLRELRRALEHPPRGVGRVRIVRHWLGMRPARTFRTALGWACLEALAGLDAWRAGTAGPWAGPGAAGPQEALAALSRWAAWVQELPG